MTNTIDKRDHKKAMSLYRQGCSDREIAEALGVETRHVWLWRRENELPSRTCKRSNIYTQLYKNGFTDSAIAYVCEVSPSAVAGWRKNRGLKPNHTADMEKSIERIYGKISNLYYKCMTDKQIAETLDIHHSIVTDWRKINALPEMWDGQTNYLHDKESLYCDTEFLEKITQKQL